MCGIGRGLRCLRLWEEGVGRENVMDLLVWVFMGRAGLEVDMMMD